MAAKIAYFMILGKPLIAYTGVLALLGFAVTGVLGFLIYTGRANIPIRWHLRLAIASLIIAIAHGLMGILLYF